MPPLEDADYIGELEPENPLGTDGVNRGDDQLRLLKRAIQATFPGMGGTAWRVQTKSTAYTLTPDDNMSVIRSSASMTLTLPAIEDVGTGFMVMLDGGANMAIAPDGAELINGAASASVATSETGVLWVSGAGWRLAKFGEGADLGEGGTIEGDVIFNGDVTFNGDVIFNGTVDLPDNTVEWDDLKTEVKAAITQWLCLDIPDEDEERYFHLPICEILEAFADVDTASDTGAITVDLEKVSGAVSLFTTAINIAEDAVVSDDNEVLDSGETTIASRTRMRAFFSGGANFSGVKIYIRCRWGAPVADSVPSDPPPGSQIGKVEFFAGSVPTATHIPLTTAPQTANRSTYSDLHTYMAAASYPFGAGNGSTTFGLPGAPGRVPMASGTGDLTTRTLGDTAGAETVTLTAAQSGVPAHTHTGETGASTDGGDIEIPVGVQDAEDPGALDSLTRWDQQLDTETFGVAGHTHPFTTGANATANASQAHTNIQPSIVFNWGIRYVH